MALSNETIGGRGTRRKIICLNCGRHKLPSRRQRASRFKPICSHCGYSRFEERSDLLDAEIAVVQLTKGNAREIDGRIVL